MGFACWINKATMTHLEYVIRIVFPLQQLLRESASILRYPYLVCPLYRGADKSLGQPGRKQANVSVRMA